MAFGAAPSAAGAVDGGRRRGACRSSLAVWLYFAYDRDRGRLPVRRVVRRWCRRFGISYQLGARRHGPRPRAADRDHPLRRRLCVVDGEDARPGVLRAAAAARHRRLRRVRLARPLRLLPLLRDRRAADVPAHRHLGIERGSAAAGHLRLGVQADRRRHEGIRGDEADAVSAARVRVHPRRHPRALHGRRIDELLVPRSRSRCSSRRGCSRGCSSRSTSASASSPASGRCTPGRPTATPRRRPRCRCCTPAC